MEYIHSLISTNMIAISALILLVSYIFIAIDKIPKVTITLIGGAITILLGLVGAEKGENYFINYVDFGVIFLLVSMMIIVNISSKSGMFNWVANVLLKYTKGHPILILFMLGLFTAVTSAFLDNVTTVVLILPITFFIAEQLEINPIPYLITEIFSSNIGGTATLIGDPPNIIIGTAANLSFMDFIKELTPVVAIVLLSVLLLVVLFFRNDIKTTPEKMEKISQIDNSNTISDYHLLVRSLIVLALVILGFVTHDLTHIPAYLTAMIGASVLLLFEKPDKYLKEVEWNTIFFFVGLFIIIGGLEASGGIKLMAEWVLKSTHNCQSLTSMLILWVSGFISGVIDNIPYTATMTPMIMEIQNVMGSDYAYPLWWCLSLGACLGGNMTMIGAAANVIVTDSALKHGHKISFMEFLKYGFVVMILSLSICTIYVYCKYL